jgi:dihydrofolate reductase
MNITTIFAMGKNGEMGTDSQENHYLPWKRSPEDMKFLKAKLDEPCIFGLNNVLVATYATYSLLPASMKKQIEINNYRVVLLTADIHKKCTGNYKLLTMGSIKGIYSTETVQFNNIRNEQFASRFKQAIALALDSSTDGIDNLVYLGSPQFVLEMMSISDSTFITVFNEVLPVKITHGIGQAGLLQIERSPRKLIQTIDNGYIMEVVGRCYNINNY